jgi:DNA-binding transcriptional LysR family regulator
VERLPLNVPRLRVLYELTRRGSVTAVADALWITPSAVSQHLAALEREVGIGLVERVGRGVKPTDAGRRLALDAERVLAALDVAGATARELAVRDDGALRVAAFPSVVLSLLAPALARLRRVQPGLTVDVIDVEGIAGLDHVRLGRADLAVVDDWGWDLGAVHAGLAVVPLMADPLYALLPASHPQAGAAAVRWSDLARDDWVIEQGDSLFTDQIAAHCRRAGFEPRVRARVRDHAAHAALVGALGLVTVLPRSAITPGADLVALPLLPGVRRQLMVVARENLARRPPAGRLITTLQAVADDLTAAAHH